ncbi:hypothetical protein [Myceligenerans salitolerans]|uniref:Uncharacterized protein n=1 Tax=Myceligenerans salitolerans TaxID=1230528 RepID=A0ABS3I5S6_9MICO|nr:hypothetical protein [Myceligenerans salitolerans]MBO0608351.1 hypothetical protein [Myceligenerans salitolerans]
MGKYSENVGEWVYERRSAFVAGTGALVVTMLCAGGAVALMIDDQPRYEAGAAAETVLIPAIVTADTAVAESDVAPGSVDRLVDESRDRSVQTIAAAEVVYDAAERSAVAAPTTLLRLRGALDEASRVVEEDLPDDASQERRERHLRELETQRASVLDAASVVTQVRRVPAEQLPEGTTTVTDPVVEPPEQPEDGSAREPSEQPSGQPSDTPFDGPTDLPVPPPSGEPSGGPSADTPGDPSDGPSAGTVPAPSQDPTTSPPAEPEDGGLADDLGGLFDKGAATDDGTATDGPTPSPSGTPAG